MTNWGVQSSVSKRQSWQTPVSRARSRKHVPLLLDFYPCIDVLRTSIHLRPACTKSNPFACMRPLLNR